MTPGQETPPIPDPIKAGEMPDKQGRVGKAKGGRPKGSTKEEKVERDKAKADALLADQESKAHATARDVMGLFAFAFHLIAVRAGEHWELTDEESESLAYRLARVDQKYGAPLENYAPELALIGCAMTITLPRLVIQAEMATAKEVKVEEVQEGE